MIISQAKPGDFDSIYPILREVISAGDTYTYDRGSTKEQIYGIWMETPTRTFIASIDEQVVGTYYIKANQAGGGSHVCNCGYMVGSSARGQGVARSMCEHSQVIAKQMGYRAMQFNFVLSSNEVAVALWSKLGYETVGRLSSAFEHPTLGYVDALVMCKWLDK